MLCKLQGANGLFSKAALELPRTRPTERGDCRLLRRVTHRGCQNFTTDFLGGHGMCASIPFPPVGVTPVAFRVDPSCVPAVRARCRTNPPHVAEATKGTKHPCP